MQAGDSMVILISVIWRLNVKIQFSLGYGNLSLGETLFVELKSFTESLDRISDKLITASHVAATVARILSRFILAVPSYRRAAIMETCLGPMDMNRFRKNVSARQPLRGGTNSKQQYTPREMK